MTEKEHHPLVPTSSGSLTRATDGPDGILARMSADVLEIVRAKDRALEQARFRIGDYEFRGPDYRQILRWAEALDRSPEDVVEALSSLSSLDETIEFSVVDGCIHSLVWDFEKLPLDAFTWEDGLRINTLAYQSKPPSGYLPRTFPSCLSTLYCENMEMEELDLSGVPEIKKLVCWANQLTDLDLSDVPGLKELDCGRNQLTDLDLSDVPGLKELDCEANQLTELDLSKVPGLKTLACGENQLTELDLSKVPGLKTLACGKNQLTDLDLSKVPGLMWLSCGENQLTELDLSKVPELAQLYCWNKHLTELDIRPLKHLEGLSVNAHVQIIGTPPANCWVERI